MQQVFFLTLPSPFAEKEDNLAKMRKKKFWKLSFYTVLFLKKMRDNNPYSLYNMYSPNSTFAVCGGGG